MSSPHLLKKSFLQMPEVQILVTHFLLLSATVSLGLLFKCRYLESVIEPAPGWERGNQVPGSAQDDS